MNTVKVSEYLIKHDVSTVSLVIAHPDDEIMFFNQFLLSLNKIIENSNLSISDSSTETIQKTSKCVQLNLKINILCLTNGDNENKYGNLRENELIESCKTLLSNYQLDSNLFIYIGDFVDSMTENWNINEVKQYLNKYINHAENNLIVTFDEYGISDHINHRTCNKAVVNQFANSDSTHIWTLQTPTFIIKYLGFLTILFSDANKIDNNKIILHNNDIYQLIYLIGIMGYKHKSQMVWYRWLWWLFNSLVWNATFEIKQFPKKQN